MDPGDDMEREDKKNKEVEHSEGTEKEQEQVYYILLIICGLL